MAQVKPNASKVKRQIDTQIFLKISGLYSQSHIFYAYFMILESLELSAMQKWLSEVLYHLNSMSELRNNEVGLQQLWFLHEIILFEIFLLFSLFLILTFFIFRAIYYNEKSMSFARI